MRALRATLAAIERMSPALAGELAVPLFRRIGPRRPVLTAEAAVHELAERSTVVVRGSRVAMYRWSGGPRTALLVHGWQGRAAQFAPLIRELRAEGFAVVSFDAPAHGASSGRHTDLPQQHELVGHLLDTARPDLVVTHSFGTLAAVAALRERDLATRVVAIAPVAEPEMTLQSFAVAVGLGSPGADELRRRFSRAIGTDESVFDRYSALQHPLPAGIPLLLVHDPADRRVPVEQSLRLRDAHPRAELRLIEGAGHSRILAADETLDAVLEFAGAPVNVG